LSLCLGSRLNPETANSIMDWQALLNSYAPLLLSAFLLDLAAGDPHWFPHPVVLMGRLISRGESFLWSGKAWQDVVSGMALSLALIALAAGATWGLLYALTLLPPLIAFVLAAALASTTLATRGLLDAITHIETPLRSGNLVKARENLAHIVGRDTSALNEDKVLRASLESLAENTSDGIVAPLFYLFLGGIPLAMAYKAINTLDSMIGYRTERYFYFGKFAARLDDVANFIPARLTALLMVIATFLVRLNAGLALRVLRRDHANHLSPNAGYPEAALAGALGIRLGGPSVYFGKEVRKPTLGDDFTPVKITMLKEARCLCLVTAILSLVTFVLISTAAR
jgi:adenosylcobinamide-phosphate synthase